MKVVKDLLMLYVPTPKAAKKIMFELVGLKPGDKLIDLGSGDSDLVITAAIVGALAVGYEYNPALV